MFELLHVCEASLTIVRLLYVFYRTYRCSVFLLFKPLFEVHTCPLVALWLYLHSLESGSIFKSCRVCRGRRSCERASRSRVDADRPRAHTSLPFVTSSRTRFAGSSYSSRPYASVLGSPCSHHPLLSMLCVAVVLPSSYLICPFLTFVISCPPFCSRNSPHSPSVTPPPSSPCRTVYAHHPASVIFSL